MHQAETTATFQTGLVHAALTDIGMRRSTNQDSHAVIIADNAEQWQTRGHFFLVADGMGAHAAGELASKMAAENIAHRYHKHTDVSPPEALKLAIEEANTEIHRRGEANPEFHNMGTTCSALVLLPQGAFLGHVGDSRVYRVRGARVEQLTFDHSLQWELRASGQLPPGLEMSGAVPKNVITRSLGPGANVQVDLEGPLPIELNDKYLLCSDGLTGKVDDDEIGVVLNSMPMPDAARLLVDLANLRGGPDNITCLVAQVSQEHLSTAVARAEPIRLGAIKIPGKVSPLFLTTASVGALAALVLLIMGAYIPAGVAAVIAAVAGLVTWVKSQGSASGGTVLGRGLKLGKGPYAAASAVPSAAFVEKLESVCNELREATNEGGWEIDWKSANEQCRVAVEQAKKGQFAAAVQAYGRAITNMMQQLRNQNPQGGRNGGDSPWIQY